MVRPAPFQAAHQSVFTTRPNQILDFHESVLLLHSDALMDLFFKNYGSHMGHTFVIRTVLER